MMLRISIPILALLAVGGAALAWVLVGCALAALLAAARLAGAALLAAVAARAFRCERSVMSRSRSPRYAAVSRSPWLAVYPAVLAVSGSPELWHQPISSIAYDTVRIAAR